MQNHEGCIRGYHRYSKSWNANKSDKIEVDFGMFIEGDGGTGTITVEWNELGGELCAKLISYDDSWSALSLFTDLIEKMGEVDGENIQEEEFCQLLDECGFKDMTSYTNPYAVVTLEEEMVDIKMPKKQAIRLGFLKNK